MVEMEVSKDLKTGEHLHLTNRPSDFCPYRIDIVVQGLQGEDLQLGLRIGEEAQNSCGRGQARHNANRTVSK